MRGWVSQLAASGFHLPVPAAHQGAGDLAEGQAALGERQQWVPERLWVHPGPSRQHAQPRAQFKKVQITGPQGTAGRGAGSGETVT